MTSNTQWLQNFLQAESVLTLATTDVCGPWSAPVLYAADFNNGCPELYFLSSASSRHIRNLNDCTGSSGSVYSNYSGDWKAIKGVQMYGLVSEVVSNISQVESVYFKKFPEIAKIINHPASQQDRQIGRAFEKSCYYRFSATYARSTDNSGNFASRQEWEF
ncbi:MAG: pyridoxamine 5'-phosphate oxidase family protein [Porticoccaceae bacterium]